MQIIEHIFSEDERLYPAWVLDEHTRPPTFRDGSELMQHRKGVFASKHLSGGLERMSGVDTSPRIVIPQRPRSTTHRQRRAAGARRSPQQPPQHHHVGEEVHQVAQREGGPDRLDLRDPREHRSILEPPHRPRSDYPRRRALRRPGEELVAATGERPAPSQPRGAACARSGHYERT